MDFWKGFALGFVGSLAGIVVSSVVYLLSLMFFDTMSMRLFIVALVTALCGLIMWWKVYWYTRRPGEIFGMSMWWTAPCIWLWVFAGDYLILMFDMQTFVDMPNRMFFQCVCGVVTVCLIAGVTATRHNAFFYPRILR